MFTLEIRLENAAMQTYDDLIVALAGLASKLAATYDVDDTPAKGDMGAIRDANGNTVGTWRYEAAR